MTTTRILGELRNLMKNLKIDGKAVQAYIIPSSDAHGSEYLSEKDKRRQFISGFTGSAGTALVTQDNALLWTDGRYFLQASQQLDSNWKLMKDGLDETPSLSAWLIKNMPPSSIVGVDATLYEEDLFINLENSLSYSTLQLKNIEPNLVDIVWSTNRPKLECNELLKVDLNHCGRRLGEKLRLIRAQMDEKNSYSIVATSLDEIAWLLNLRSSDIPFNTVFFSYCIITKSSLQLYIDLNRLTDEIRSYLLNEEPNIEFFEYDSFFQEFQNFYKNEFLNDQQRKASKIWLCPRSSHMLHSLVDEKYLHKEISYLTKLKIIKNKDEISASKFVHIKDSAVLCEFWHWIENQMKNYESLGEDFNEFNVAKYLDSLRMNTSGCLKPSFETICSTGANGSIIHYKPEEGKSKKIEKNNLLLLDSGGHYIDAGTTDVTRTVFLGDKSFINAYQKECFTRVLKGHIQLASKIFPFNTRAELLDSFARASLWQVGLDYRHGTGHGVGHVLNVHELPIIGTRKYTDIGVCENMIVTIEPGFYEDQNFGIRIENCELVVEAKTKFKNFNSKPFLTFEPLTYVPIQRELIDVSLLDLNEIEWINNYHKKCLELTGARLREENKIDVYNWLIENTKELF